MSQLIEIYHISQLKGFSRNVWDTAKVSGNIEYIKSLISTKNGKGYHERLNGTDKIRIFGDIDHYFGNIEQFKDSLTNAMNEVLNLNITKEDIKFTFRCTNKTTNEQSYHWVIPRYCMELKQMKKLMEHIYNTYFSDLFDDKKKGEESLDVSVYSNGRWFRLPNQLKDGVANTEHIILNGNIEDFVLKYVFECEEKTFIEDNTSQPKKKKRILKKEENKTHNIETTITLHQEFDTESIITEIPSFQEEIKKDENTEDYEIARKAILSIHLSKIDNYNSWKTAGFIFKNEFTDTAGFNLWLEFSKRGQKFDGEEELRKLWNKIDGKGEYDNRVTLGTLYHWAKENDQSFFIGSGKKSLFHESPETKSIQNGMFLIEESKKNIKKLLEKIPTDTDQTEKNTIAYSIFNILNENYEESFLIYDEWLSKGINYKGTTENRHDFNLIQQGRKQQGGHKYRMNHLKELVKNHDSATRTDIEEMTPEEKNKLKWLEYNLQTAEHVKNIIFERKRDEFMWILDNEGEMCHYSKDYRNFYCFENGKWYNHDEKLKNYIKNILYHECNDLLESLREKIKIGKYNLILKKINMLVEPKFQEKILECSKSDNEAKRSDIRFDENPELLGFKNGVLNLKTGLFRKYRYDDFISMSTGWNYNADEEGNPIIDEQKKNELWEYLHSMFRNEEQRQILDYLLHMYASSLNGYTYRKFFILTGGGYGGGGSNGKSRLNANHCRILGEYALQNPDNSLLFNSKNGPNPELVALEKKRYVRFCEPNSGASFNVEFIQKICDGTNKISGRNCFSNKTNVYISGTVSCECNKTPDFPSNNNASRDRLRVIPYKTVFSNGCEGDQIIDNITVFPTCSTYTEEWFYERRMEWISILLPYSIKLLQTPLEFKVDTPKAITDASSVYLSKSNLVIRWFEENYEKCEEVIQKTPIFIKLKDMYDEFQTTNIWKEMSKKEKRDLSYKNFIIFFTQRVGYKEEYKYRLEGKCHYHTNILKGYRKIYFGETISENIENIEFDLIID